MTSFNFKKLFNKSKLYNSKSLNKNIELIENFALAEFGSALDMLAASELSENIKLKKGYLNHAIDEFNHADLFFQHAKLMSKNNLQIKVNSSPVAELGEKIRYLNFIGEKPIYSELKEIDFINFVMISELAAQKYFNSLSLNTSFDIETRNLFKKIALEEGNHVEYAKNELILRKKNGTKGLIKSYYFIKWFRFKTDILANSRYLWVFLGNQLLNIIYFLLFPVTKVFSKRNYKNNDKINDPYSMV